jgi:hypothetical protein
VYQFTQDISDKFFQDLKYAVAPTLGNCDPLDILRPLMNESGLSFKAHNTQGNASGIFQAMPSTLKNLGFPGTWQDFVQLDADAQLFPWLWDYYRPYAGKLTNATAVYMATFCPAWIDHAVEPDFVICGNGPTSNVRLSPSMNKIWYAQNRGFDHDNKGFITVSDLTQAIARADTGARWAEIVDRLNASVSPV